MCFCPIPTMGSSINEVRRNTASDTSDTSESIIPRPHSDWAQLNCLTNTDPNFHLYHFILSQRVMSSNSIFWTPMCPMHPMWCFVAPSINYVKLRWGIGSHYCDDVLRSPGGKGGVKGTVTSQKYFYIIILILLCPQFSCIYIRT